MSNWRTLPYILVLVVLSTLPAQAQESAPGSIRGLVLDEDFGTGLEGVSVQIVESGETVRTTESGNFVFAEVAGGVYTLVFSKVGYVRGIRTDVSVSPGSQTQIDIELAGEYVQMEEFIVEDILQLGGGAEAALLNLRFESPSLLDSISSDLMAKAGASDAAGALRLVSGASVQNGKFAVIRGLPDRYVSSQLNGVRLPTADADKRAVELDQFPASVLESIQVSKTFTPDQQGDASGGAVDVRLRSIPEEFVLQLSAQLGFNTLAGGRTTFLSYDGGGLSFWGKEDGQFDPQLDNIGGNWDGAVGVNRIDSPIDSKWSAAIGGKRLLDSGVTVGAFGSFFYERDSAFFNDGIADAYWIEGPGEPLTPEFQQGAPSGPGGQDGDFLTSLFDVTQASQLVQWGNLATLGVETNDHLLTLTYLYSRTTQDTATLAENTRGKEYFFPGYDPDDPEAPGNTQATRDASPYIRTQALEYNERTTSSLQFHGEHVLPISEFGLAGLTFLEPKFNWTYSRSDARSWTPDRRLFGSTWKAASFSPGIPPFSQDTVLPAIYEAFKPAQNVNFGNLQRIFEDIEEESSQFAANFELPFDQWAGEEGAFRVGMFDDTVDRTFDQDTFGNFDEEGLNFEAEFETPWSDFWLDQDHPITQSPFDIDYDGEIGIQAFYAMIDLPLSERVNVVTGARLESTDIGVTVFPGPDALFFPLEADTGIQLTPGAADVAISRNDILPSLGLSVDLSDELVLRASASKTIARQTFKELTPIIQQEFLGGPIFIGNANLGVSQLENFDLRLDYTPSAGSFFSVSLFHKKIEDPIEYVSVVRDFTFTSAVNYPEGELSGIELEARQDFGELWAPLVGFSGGANATFLDATVQLTDEEIFLFSQPNIQVDLTERDMTNAPEYLYNLYLNYDFGQGTETSLFYTVKGDTLFSGAATSNGNFVPNIYEREIGDLNFQISHAINDHTRIRFRANNLLDTDYVQVFRPLDGPDVTRISESRGIDLSLSVSLFL